MFGVPANLDLSQLQGDCLTQICLGEFDLQFRFGGGGNISVWSNWQIRDASGTVIDQAIDPPAQRESYKLHVLLGRTITTFTVDPPRSFTLHFDSGMMLTVFDDSRQF